MREHDLGAVELHVIEQPRAQRRQVGDGLDVVIASPCEQPHPPATRFLAEHERPVGLDSGGATHRERCLRVWMAARLPASCNAAMSDRCRYSDNGMKSTHPPFVPANPRLRGDGCGHPEPHVNAKQFWVPAFAGTSGN